MRFSILGYRAFLKVPGKRRLIAATAIVASSLFLVAFGVGMVSADGDYVTHEVAKGENIFRLSLKYGVRISSILDANGITNPDYVEAGRILLIPKNDASSSMQTPLVKPASMTQPATNSQKPAQNTIHTVQRAENLFRISLRYQISVPELLQTNGLSDPDYVQAGQELIIPSGPVIISTLITQSNLATAPEPPEVTTSDGDWDDAFRLTHYCLNGPMSSTRWVYNGAVAADKSIFPLGKRLLIEGLGVFTVEDRFAWDANQKRLDIWVPTCWEAVERGVQYRRVKVLN